VCAVGADQGVQLVALGLGARGLAVAGLPAFGAAADGQGLAVDHPERVRAAAGRTRAEPHEVAAVRIRTVVHGRTAGGQLTARGMRGAPDSARPFRLCVVAGALPPEAAEERCAAGDDDLDRAHRKRGIGILRKVADALRVIARPPCANVAAFEANPAGGRREHPRDQLQQRRFARSVRPRQRDELRLIDPQRDIANGSRSVVRIRHRADLEHQPLLRRSDRKKGTPRRAVNAPIGSSDETVSIRDARSASTSRIAPPRAESGSVAR